MGVAKRTYSHLGAEARMPSTYEVASTDLLYYRQHGFAVDNPVTRFHAAHCSSLVLPEVETFYDPRATTYGSYVELQRRREAFASELFARADIDRERAFPGPWVSTLERVFAPLRYPCHALMMLSSYVASLAGSSRWLIALGLQAADETRRVHRLAERLYRLRAAHPGLGEAARSTWEKDAAWQPLREVVERALVTYDLGEAVAVLNFALKPALDELIDVALARAARRAGDDVTAALLDSFADDAAWHAACADAWLQAIGDIEGNRERLAAWAAPWTERCEAAVDELSVTIFGLEREDLLASRAARSGRTLARGERRMSLDLAFIEHVFENGFDAVGAIDSDFTIRFWNAQLAELSRVSPQRAIGSRLHDVFPRLRDSDGERVLRQALAGKGAIGSPPYFGVADLRHALEYGWFASPVCERDSIEGAVFVGRWSVARGAMRQQMMEAEQRFRSMADSSPVLLWMAGRDAMCDFFNATWLAFSGRSLEQEVGVGWADGVHPEDFERCMNVYMQAFAARQAFEMEYRLRRHDGVYRWLLDRGAPRFTPTGEFAGFIGSCVDITDRIQAEQATRDLASELRRSNEYMEKLLYATSHDLREPMRMVATYIDLLEQHLGRDVDERSGKYLRYARDGAARMRAVVEGLLSFATVRGSEPRSEVVDLSAVVRTIVEELSPTIESEGGEVTSEALPHVIGDPALLQSLLTNLLRNALKFRGEAPARVSISARREANQHVLCVADNGIGFEQEFAEKVFEMFQRLHARDRYPGSGIGLALAKDIAERHGGRIWAESAPGKGARFFVALPVEA